MLSFYFQTSGKIFLNVTYPLISCHLNNFYGTKFINLSNMCSAASFTCLLTPSCIEFVFSMVSFAHTMCIHYKIVSVFKIYPAHYHADYTLCLSDMVCSPSYVYLQLTCRCIYTQITGEFLLLIQSTLKHIMCTTTLLMFQICSV